MLLGSFFLSLFFSFIRFTYLSFCQRSNETQQNSLTVNFKSFGKKSPVLLENTTSLDVHGMTWSHLLCPPFLFLTCMTFFAWVMSVFNEEQCSGFALNNIVMAISNHMCTVLHITKSILLCGVMGPTFLRPTLLCPSLWCPSYSSPLPYFDWLSISPFHYLYNGVFTVCTRIKRTTSDC